MALAYSAQALAYLGEASLALDRLRETEQLLDRQSAEGNVCNGWISFSLGRASLLLGDITTHPTRVDAERGRAYYGRAMALAEARRMRPLVAHCHLGLGVLHGRSGERPNTSRQR